MGIDWEEVHNWTDSYSRRVSTLAEQNSEEPLHDRGASPDLFGPETEALLRRSLEQEGLDPALRAHRLFNLALILRRQEKPAQALEALEEASVLDPVSADILNETGLIYDELGRVRLAEDYYRRALAADDQCFSAWNNLGVLAFTRGDYTEARRCFSRSLELNPESYSARENLKDTLEELGAGGEPS